MKLTQQYFIGIFSLLTVKTIITIIFIVIFSFQTITGREISNEFMYLMFTIVAYYFATDNICAKCGEKKSYKGKDGKHE